MVIITEDLDKTFTKTLNLLIKTGKIAFVDRVGATYEVTHMSIFSEGITLSGWEVGHESR